ncbi:MULTISPECIES: DUF29 domain-containing protein [unclassified Halomonas]|uniref:DUF29 domain-containing protein n=1 Tax=unclassified Halomonas TaxID=2609666 RepID=UPI000BC30B29|nr:MULTISPECIES: DUF29 domain-containing protein [unclassified Halomonas]ATH76844.1 hypothetical protein CLM76_04210 [Halomonas hydrothermalis]UDM07563.1 DUF29 domain-containing protein [Halomonas sp. NyZ770]
MAIHYEQDAYAWALEQAGLLRAGELDKLDLEHLAEEIESMGKNERRALIRQLARLLMYLLTWDYQPERRSRSWRLTIQDAQAKTQRLLEDNPSLNASLPELMCEAYDDARRAAAIEADREPQEFPEQCLYGFEEAMSFQPSQH